MAVRKTKAGLALNDGLRRIGEIKELAKSVADKKVKSVEHLIVDLVNVCHQKHQRLVLK